MICFIQCRILTASGRENRPHRSRTAPAQRNRFSSLSLMHTPPAQGPAAHLCSRGLVRSDSVFPLSRCGCPPRIDGRVAAHGRDHLLRDRHRPGSPAATTWIIGTGIDRHGAPSFHTIIKLCGAFGKPQISLPNNRNAQTRASQRMPRSFSCIEFNFPSGSAACPRADTP